MERPAISHQHQRSQCPECGHDFDLPPPEQLGKVALMADTLHRTHSLAVLSELSEASDRPIRLLSYTKAMRDRGYTREAAIAELEELVRSGKAKFTEEYRVELISG